MVTRRIIGWFLIALVFSGYGAAMVLLRGWWFAVMVCAVAGLVVGTIRLSIWLIDGT